MIIESFILLKCFFKCFFSVQEGEGEKHGKYLKISPKICDIRSLPRVIAWVGYDNPSHTFISSQRRPETSTSFKENVIILVEKIILIFLFYDAFLKISEIKI